MPNWTSPAISPTRLRWHLRRICLPLNLHLKLRMGPTKRRISGLQDIAQTIKSSIGSPNCGSRLLSRQSLSAKMKAVLCLRQESQDLALMRRGMWLASVVKLSSFSLLKRKRSSEKRPRINAGSVCKKNFLRSQSSNRSQSSGSRCSTP